MTGDQRQLMELKVWFQELQTLETYDFVLTKSERQSWVKVGGCSSWDAHLVRNVAYWFQFESEGISHYCQWQCKWPINHRTFKKRTVWQFGSINQSVRRWTLKWSVFHHRMQVHMQHACIPCNTTIIYNIQWIMQKAWRVTLHGGANSQAVSATVVCLNSEPLAPLL